MYFLILQREKERKERKKKGGGGRQARKHESTYSVYSQHLREILGPKWCLKFFDFGHHNLKFELEPLMLTLPKSKPQTCNHWRRASLYKRELTHFSWTVLYTITYKYRSVYHWIPGVNLCQWPFADPRAKCPSHFRHGLQICSQFQYHR